MNAAFSTSHSRRDVTPPPRMQSVTTEYNVYVRVMIRSQLIER